MTKIVKIPLEANEIYPDFREETHPDFVDLKYKIPEDLWNEYKEARSKYLEAREKMLDIYLNTDPEADD